MRVQCPDGHHASMAVKYVHDSQGAGSVMLLICEEPLCAHIQAQCEHERNTWNKEGTVLTCDLCGADGT